MQFSLQRVLALASVAALASSISPSFAQTTYKVKNVAVDDVLFVRSGPSPDHASVGEIRPDGTGILMTGPCKSDFCPISYDGTVGWVSRRFLEKDASAGPSVTGLSSKKASTSVDAAHDGLADEGTHWSLNGSLLVLSVEGGSWTFRYLEPSPGIKSEGVKPGTVLFSGTSEGERLSGTAYRFSKHCGPLPYLVQGDFEADGSLILSGEGPIRLDKKCRIAQFTNHVLTFVPK